MTEIVNKIQINTARDRLNLVLHFGVGAVMLGAAAVCSQPLALAGGVVSTALFVRGMRKYTNGAEMVLRHSAAQVPVDSLLRQAATEIASRMGVAKTPKIYILTRGQHTSDATAQLWPCGDIFMSAALVGQTGFDEQRAVVAHEMAHLRLGHIAKKRLLHYASGMARDVLLFNAIVRAGQYITEAYSLTGASLAVAGAALAFAANEVLHRNYLRVTEYEADRLGAQVTSPQLMEKMLQRVRKIDVDYHREIAEQAHDLNSFDGHPTIAKRCAALRAMMPA